MRRVTIRALLLTSLLLGASAAHAACQVDAKPVSFGVVDVQERTDTTGEIAVSCSVAVTFSIAIAGSGSPGDRFMSGPSNGRLAYELYTDPSFSTRWGDGSGAGTLVTGQSDGETTDRLTVYGRVPRQGAVPAGSYSDSLVVELSF
jgi:spore coat protein U-like protein